MRDNYLSWDAFFFGVAFLSAMRSKDPSTQTGASIIMDKRVIGVGYNGFVRGVKDTPERWESNEKLKYVEHAEENAVANCRVAGTACLRGSHLYLWTSNKRVWFPCERCARCIIQNEISAVHVVDKRETNTPQGEDVRWRQDLSWELFGMADVDIILHDVAETYPPLLALALDKLSPPYQ